MNPTSTPNTHDDMLNELVNMVQDSENDYSSHQSTTVYSPNMVGVNFPSSPICDDSLIHMLSEFDQTSKLIIPFLPDSSGFFATLAEGSSSNEKSMSKTTRSTKKKFVESQSKFGSTKSKRKQKSVSKPSIPTPDTQRKDTSSQFQLNRRGLPKRRAAIATEYRGGYIELLEEEPSQKPSSKSFNKSILTSKDSSRVKRPRSPLNRGRVSKRFKTEPQLTSSGRPFGKNYIIPIPSNAIEDHKKPPAASRGKQKKQRRLLRNKQAARSFRVRQRSYLAELERTLLDLRTERSNLIDEIKQLSLDLGIEAESPVFHDS